MDIIKHRRSDFQVSERLAQLFDGYHSISELWIKNIKVNPDCDDITDLDHTIPICRNCYNQWGNIAFFFENCKQMRGYGAIDPPFDALGKFKFAE